MSRILVTGAATGIGHSTASALLNDGHEVVVHARSHQRLFDARDLLERGAEGVTGDLAELDQMRVVAAQARELGRLDAVIHNAGIIDGDALLPVNVVAPYVLAADLPEVPRHIFVSSSMHRGGRADLEGADWSGARGTRSYSDSKLYVTTFMAAVARLRSEVISHAVCPGWVPTRMGGPHASDDLSLAHVTQVHLATAPAAEVRPNGRYWHHMRAEEPHPAVHDVDFQDELLSRLAAHTGLDLPAS